MPPLPALQVRVPNAANALLQAEQILGAREQRNALLRQQEQSANLGQLLSSDLSDPTVRQQVQRKAFAIDPNAGLQVQQMFRRMSEAERVEAERDASTIARTFFNVNSPASFASARNSLPSALQSQIPETFDPNLVRGLVDVATPLSELFANERTRMQIESAANLATLPTPPLSEARQEQEIAQIEARRTPADAAPSAQDLFKNANTLRDEFVKQTDSFAEAQQGLGRVRVGAELDTGQGDVALIFGFMKTIDPESTVREGEFATAEQTSGIADRALVSLYNRVVTGERLTPQQRQRFVEAAEAQFGEALRGYEQTAQEYTRLAEAFGLDPANVVVDRVLAGQTASQATPVVPAGASVAPDATVISTGDIQPNPANMPRPTTQEGYDLLPDGAWYIDPDSGQPIRKGR